MTISHTRTHFASLAREERIIMVLTKKSMLLITQRVCPNQNDTSVKQAQLNTKTSDKNMITRATATIAFAFEPLSISMHLSQFYIHDGLAAIHMQPFNKQHKNNLSCTQAVHGIHRHTDP